jgi:hypothetical protein
MVSGFSEEASAMKPSRCVMPPASLIDCTFP